MHYFDLLDNLDLLPPSPSLTTDFKMGCCGEPYEKQDVNNGKRDILDAGHPTNLQPSPHPGLQYQEKQFQPPNIPSPPPVQQFGGQQVVNGSNMPFMQQQQWQQPHSPPPGASSPFNPYGQSSSPSPAPVSSQFTGTTLNGIGSVQNFNTTNGMVPNGGLQRPMPSYPGTPGNPSMITTSNVTTSTLRGPDSTPLVDEGKMSVSIDFGKRLLSRYFHSAAY